MNLEKICHKTERKNKLVLGLVRGGIKTGGLRGKPNPGHQVI